MKILTEKRIPPKILMVIKMMYEKKTSQMLPKKYLTNRVISQKQGCTLSLILFSNYMFRLHISQKKIGKENEII